jgi:hypothetical protein
MRYFIMSALAPIVTVDGVQIVPDNGIQQKQSRWQRAKQLASNGYLKFGLGASALLGSAASYATGAGGGTGGAGTGGLPTLPTPDLTGVATYISKQFTPVMDIGLAVLGLMVVMALLRWARGIIA